MLSNRERVGIYERTLNRKYEEKSGVERGIRTLGSHSDIGLAVLRLTRLGHLHFNTLICAKILKYSRCRDSGGMPSCLGESPEILFPARFQAKKSHFQR